MQISTSQMGGTHIICKLTIHYTFGELLYFAYILREANLNHIHITIHEDVAQPWSRRLMERFAYILLAFFLENFLKYLKYVESCHYLNFECNLIQMFEIKAKIPS